MQSRDVLAAVGCLLIPAGLGLMLESPVLIFHQDIATLSGWILVVGGIVISAGVLLSAARESIAVRPRSGSDEAEVDPVDGQA